MSFMIFGVCTSLLFAPPTSATSPPLIQDHDEQAVRFDENGEFNPNIVIAQHAMVWNGHVVTWDKVLKEFREERANGAFTPTFYFTNKVSNSDKGWEPWKEKIWSVYSELFEPVGVTYASVMPRGGRYWDSIRSQKDLALDPTHTGRVLDSNGRPASFGQVVVIPGKEAYARLAVELKDGHLDNTVHEQTSTTDVDGKLAYRPLDQEHYVAVLHSSGFAIALIDKQDIASIALRPWATLVLTSNKPLEQKVSIEVHPQGMAEQAPSFKINEIELSEHPNTLTIPAGKIVVRASFKVGDSWMGIPQQTLEINSGESKSIEIPQPSQADRKRAEDLKHQLDKLRGKKGRSSR